MEHWILRCKHCQREYTYCTYGNGPQYGTESGCSREYCSECQKAIDEALSKIKVKFEPRIQEIDDKSLLEEFKKVRELKKTETDWNLVSFEFDSSSFDVIETYYYKNNKYYVKYNDDSEDDKHIFVMMEFDIINQCFTNKKWRYAVRDSYNKKRNHLKDWNKKLNTLSSKMEEPCGNLFFMDFRNGWM